MRLSRKHQLLLVAAVALVAALVVFGPSLYLGLLQYIPALAVNRATAAFVVAHDHLSWAVPVLGALSWNAFLGWKLCHRAKPIPFIRRTRLERWRGRHKASMQIQLVCLFHRQLRWFERHKKLRLGVLTVLGALSLVAPAGVFVGSLIVRHWKVRVWMKISAISVAYTLSCLATQESAAHLMSQPHPYEHYLMYGVYVVATYLIAGKWARRHAGRLATRVAYRPRLAHLRWAHQSMR